MKPIRTHGLYEIHGHDGKDEPFWMVPGKLDISMSLGTGKIGTDEWKPGLRKNGGVVEAQIAIYAERWENKSDPPHPMVLVLGEEAKNGVYRPSFTVIDGAMWVAAAVEAGRERVPVYVVAAPGVKIEKEAMCLYFNTVTNGLALTEKERNGILLDLAQYAKNQRGVTDKFITVNGAQVRSYEMWAAEYSRATAVAASTIVKVIRGKFTTQRTEEQLERDRQALASGEKTVKDIERESNKSKTAIRRDANRAKVKIKSVHAKASRVAKPQPDPTEAVTAATEMARGVNLKPGNGAAKHLREAIILLYPAIHELITKSEKLTGSMSATRVSEARRLNRAEVQEVWSGVPDDMWGEFVILANDLRVYNDPGRAHRDARAIIEMARTILDTLQRHDDPLAKELTAIWATEQIPLGVVTR